MIRFLKEWALWRKDRPRLPEQWYPASQWDRWHSAYALWRINRPRLR
jgi:hypothetical protein